MFNVCELTPIDYFYETARVDSPPPANREMLHAGIKRWLASDASKVTVSRVERFMTLVDCNALRRRCTAAKILHALNCC